MTILRDWSRTEGDDFKLRVAPYIGPFDGATPFYNERGIVLGWKIKPMYE